MEHQYTETEVRKILQRAGELQSAGTPGGSFGNGTTLKQLQQAATELGMDPVLIEQAANELATVDSTEHGSRWLGGPWGIDSDHLVPNSITEENWPMLLDEMRAATGRVGTPKAVGKAYEWLSSQPDSLHVTLTPHGKKTRVRVKARFGEWGTLYYGLLPMMVFLLTLIVCAVFGKHSQMTPGLFAALVTGFPLAAALAGRVAFGRLCARKRRQTRHLITRVEQVMMQPMQEVTAQNEVVQEGVSASSVLPVTVLQPADEPLLVMQKNQTSG